ncbi:MAG: histidine kinase, partial [Cyanobacteria bacterium J06636_16]
MSAFRYALTPDRLDKVFPFHLAFDTSLAIAQVGHALAGILQQSIVGKPLTQEFAILRPKLTVNFDAILSKQNQLFFLKHNHSQLQLKGQIIFLEEDQALLFLCSPWAADSTVLPQIGIRLKDYAIHDSMIDYLLLQRTHRTALEDLKKVNKEL